MDRWGVAEGYWDVEDTWHDTPPETVEALHRAMGAEGDGPPARPYWGVVEGDATGLQSPCDLVLEDGTTLGSLTALPPDLPVGYHRLQPLDAGPATRLVVRPARPVPAPFGWGWATQLYGLRSGWSWGYGDLGDLGDLARWTVSLGGIAIQVSPLHAPVPVPSVENSPYFPSSRRFRNVLHLRVGDVPGATSVAGRLGNLDEAGRSLNQLDRIDRDEVLRLKLDGLGAIFAASTPPAAFDEWRAAEGEALELWATYCTLAERHGPSWTTWPDELRHPSARAVGEAAAANADRVTFHAWCQWLFEQQLGAARRTGVAIVGDIAVGFDAGGFDGWYDQDLLALGCRVGAPPDTFAKLGQDWGLPPYVPWKLREVDYRPWVETLRANVRQMAGVRLDHVMGLSRLYWIPPDADATQGAYVHFGSTELLDIVAVEAHRAGVFVIGEDLGTVEDELRDALRERGFLGTTVALFEDDPPPKYRPDALAVMTTHDLGTVAGILTGTDRAAVLQAAGRALDDSEMRARLVAMAPGTSSVAETVVAAHRALAASPSRLTLVNLEDAVGSVLRPNLPGTVDEWPNWRLPLPAPLEELAHHPLLPRVVDAVVAGRAEAGADVEAEPTDEPAGTVPEC